MPELNDTEIKQLQQISQRPIWDGDLMSKEARSALVQMGLVDRVEGFNCISLAGARMLILEPSHCGVSGHFKFQLNGGSCLMCQRECQLVTEAKTDSNAAIRKTIEHIVEMFGTLLKNADKNAVDIRAALQQLAGDPRVPIDLAAVALKAIER